MTRQTLHTSRREGALYRALLFLVALLWGSVITYAAVSPSNSERQAFIEKISQIAIVEQASSGIPASITAAQAIFESSWGKSRLATSGNNYFGIKCKSWWTGETILHQDDDYNEQGELTYSCFRAYESIEDSFTDHTIFLLSSERYAPLFKLDPTDYKGWAHGLKQCGYATDPAYAHKLIGLIERLKLYKLDQKAFVETELVPLSSVQQIATETIVNASAEESSRPRESTPEPPPSTPIPESYVPSGKGERPAVRIH